MKELVGEYAGGDKILVFFVWKSFIIELGVRCEESDVGVGRLA